MSVCVYLLLSARGRGDNYGVECPPHHGSWPKNTVNHPLTNRERPTVRGRKSPVRQGTRYTCLGWDVKGKEEDRDLVTRKTFSILSSDNTSVLVCLFSASCARWIWSPAWKSATWGSVWDASSSTKACSGWHGGGGRERSPEQRISGPGAAASALSEGPPRAAAELSPLQTGGLLSGGQNDQQRVICQSDGRAAYQHRGKGRSWIKMRRQAKILLL